MIRIAISDEASEAIARTLKFGSVHCENKTNERGERYVWLDHAVVSRLRSMRGRRLGGWMRPIGSHSLLVAAV
jgi:hypothetical protein